MPRAEIAEGPARCEQAARFVLLSLAWHFRHRDRFLFHKGFQQGHSLREGVRAAFQTAGTPGGLKRRMAVAVFGSQVCAMGDEELDEFIEAVFGGAV
jgi:hypothetical protein